MIAFLIWMVEDKIWRMGWPLGLSRTWPTDTNLVEDYAPRSSVIAKESSVPKANH
jgi:hypothetical protein